MSQVRENGSIVLVTALVAAVLAAACSFDASKAKTKLGWTPKVRFKELIEMMVKSDEADVRASLQGRAPAV